LQRELVSIQERHISVAKKVKKTSKKKATAKKSAAKKKRQVKKTAVRKKGAKKVAAKKTGKKKVLKRRRKRTLTAKEIQHFKEMLLKKRAELVGDVNSIESDALKKSRLDAAGDLSSMPIHMADLGTDNFEQEFALGLMDSERKILAEINEALGRIDEGVYGICEGTGKPIAKARLEANPWARYCIKYATMVEQGLVREGEKIVYEPEEEYEADNELDEFEEFDEDDEFDDKEQ
jgi:RNA polymerase-binding protein DksA